MGSAKSPWSSQLLAHNWQVMSSLAGKGADAKRNREEGGRADWVTLKGLSGKPKDEGFVSHTQQPIARAASQGGPHMWREQRGRGTELSTPPSPE